MKRALPVVLACLAFGSACATSSTPLAMSLISEPTANEVSPRLSFCFGRTAHCVMPDFNLSTVNYDLVKKKWESGVTGIGVGYELLFFSDRPWASGIALHGAGRWSQEEPSYFGLTPTLVFARYFEAGCTIKLMDGSVGRFITLGLGASWDLLTGRTIGERLVDARMKRLFEESRRFQEGR